MKGPGDPDWGVRVTWYGHACFSVEDSAKRVFLIDPFDTTVGYDEPRISPDAVLITHNHFDHNFMRSSGNYELMSSTGINTVAGVEVTGVLGDHDDRGGQRHGHTHFYVWEMGGLRLAHLGDVGQKDLTHQQLQVLGEVDVLFVPVGGQTTVDAAGAAALARQVKPRVVVPMHYGNVLVRFYEFDPVGGFLEKFQDVHRLETSTFQISRQSLPPGLTVYVPRLPAKKL